MKYYVSTGLWPAERVEKLYQAKKITKEHYDELKALLTLPTDKSGDSRFADRSLHRARSYKVSPSVTSRVSHGRYVAYANRRKPSFKMFFAALMSRSWC